MVEAVKPNEVSVQNRPAYNQLGRRGFLPGNPGKQTGMVNHTTRIRNQFLSLVGRHQVRMLKNAMKNPSTFLWALEKVIIPLLGRGAQIHIGDNVESHVTQTNNFTQARQIVKQFNPEQKNRLQALLAEVNKSIPDPS
jgi:hypothetical protein